VTGQQSIVGCRLDDVSTLLSGGQPGIRSSGQRGPAGVFADPGHTFAAMPEQDAGIADVAQLVRRAAKGDHWAWERLVDQYARLIWAMTRDFKLVESDAADVFQATWLRLLENIDRLEQPARVGSWLAATARHECLRCLSARKKVMLVHDDVTLKMLMADPPVPYTEISDQLGLPVGSIGPTRGRCLERLRLLLQAS